MSAIRRAIREAITEMAARTAATLPEPFALFLDDFTSGNRVRFFLSDGSRVIGYFSMEKYPGGRWYAGTVWAPHGFGPLLYRAAMEYATSHGVGLRQNRHGSTSDEAQAVWDVFEKQAGRGEAGVGSVWDPDECETFYALPPGSSDLSELLARGRKRFDSDEAYESYVEALDSRSP